MKSGRLTLCKGCEISPVKTKTKHCFMKRDISKLWVIQVDCKNRIHDHPRWSIMLPKRDDNGKTI
ncbi:12107_t:CDS:2 [Gigaspora rosea]|nr:12107_t:CDS:2 [Gigaspora rosea]